MSQTLVIIPTYNEKENIEKLIRLLLALNLNLDILVVDDNSPDGTGAVVESLKVESSKVNLLSRLGERGFASAYLAGFSWALARPYQYIIQMDADLSHQPQYLPDMIKLLGEYDLVIGSRYVAGGGIIGWPWYRRLLSKFASFYGQKVLKVGIKDLTGGFNCYRRQVLETLNLQQLVSQGYAFLLELKYKTLLAGFALKEQPIVFMERSQGKSKISKKIIWEAALNCWRLRYKKKSDISTAG